MGGFNKQTEVTKPARLTVCRGQDNVHLPARLEPRGDFPGKMEVLLSARACRRLGIDVNHALYQLPWILIHGSW